MQKLEAENELHEHIYTLPTGVQRARALFGIVELTGLRWEDPEDNSVCP
jgi:hypothetical protein